jgi:hypothetical protein
LGVQSKGGKKKENPKEELDAVAYIQHRIPSASPFGN